MSMKLFVLVILFIVTMDMVSCKSAKNTDTDICKLAQERGRCRALIPKWRYDHGAGKCLEFKYGGCGGNANNFSSEKECLQKCAGH